MHKDFLEFLATLKRKEVRFVIVGDQSVLLLREAVAVK